MQLNDSEILRLGADLISPFEYSHVQPASYDLTLGRNIKFETRHGWADIDLRARLFTLVRGDFILARTVEKVKIPPYLAARVEGKSSLGRQGVVCHITAGFIDPGFEGYLTLEMMNVSNRGFQLVDGMKIAQIGFYRLVGKAVRPYGHPALGSHYQGQRDEPVVSWRDKE